MNDSTLADFTKGKCILDKDDKAGLAQQTRSDIVKRIVKEMIVSSHGSLLSGLLCNFTLLVEHHKLTCGPVQPLKYLTVWCGTSGCGRWFKTAVN